MRVLIFVLGISLAIGCKCPTLTCDSFDGNYRPYFPEKPDGTIAYKDSSQVLIFRVEANHTDGPEKISSGDVKFVSSRCTYDEFCSMRAEWRAFSGDTSRPDGLFLGLKITGGSPQPEDPTPAEFVVYADRDSFKFDIWNPILPNAQTQTNIRIGNERYSKVYKIPLTRSLKISHVYFAENAGIIGFIPRSTNTNFWIEK